jgi:flagellar biosynthesis chaperone FliJ
VETIQKILEDEKEALFDDLTDLRNKKIDESGPEVQKVRDELRHVINVLKDIEQGRIELVGPDPL